MFTHDCKRLLSMRQFLKIPGRADHRRYAVIERLPFMAPLFRYKDPDKNGLRYWRERIVFAVLAAGVGLSLLALVPAVRMAFSEKLWTLFFFDLMAMLLMGSLLLSRRISLEVRTASVLLMSFLIGVVVIWQVGFVSGGTAWLFCFGILTGVLRGLRAALAAVVLNALALSSLAWLARQGLVGDQNLVITTGRAVAAIANFSFLNAVGAISVAVLVNGLQSLNLRANRAARDLKHQQRKLLAARESLKQEIAERVESEQAARESGQKYRLLAENIRDVIWTMDVDFKLTYVSPAVTRMQGWPVEEFLDLTLDQIMTPASCKKVLHHYGRQYSLGERTGDFNRSVTLEVELHTKSGGTVWSEVTAGFLLGTDGRPSGILGVSRDITERRQAEMEKEELLESLNRSRKMEALGTLAGGVAHDLNNVLAGIVSYPDLLLMDIPEDSPLKQPIEIMRASGQKAAAIVQDLLTLARRGLAVTEAVDLNALIKEYLCSPEFERLQSFHPQVRVETALAPDLGSTPGSPVHLSKTLMNLISNAAEAMPDGGRLIVSTENRRIDAPLRGYTKIPEGEYNVLTVADTGVGISHDDVNRIFEPFYTKKKMGRSGTGLGMAVVWGTVQDHDGYIDIRSAVGRGTRISIYLPACDEKCEQADVPVAGETRPGRGQSVLIVDDVGEQREVAARILEQLGYSPVCAASGEEAVAYMEENSVDLLLLDMIMEPGIDGLETYRRILEFHPRQKALITSGYAQTDRVESARALGPSGYLKKPYTVGNLRTSIEQVLNG